MKILARFLCLSLALPIAATALHAQQDAASTPAAAPAATMLRMRDGSIHWGTITAHDPEGIVFERLENGGRVRLAWSLMHPDEERDLRSKFGYVDLSGDEVMIDADRIVTIDGTEVIGLIIDKSGDFVLVKTDTATIPVPKNRISGAPTVVQVPATEVYTRAELYAQGLSNVDTSSAEGNFKLAQWCERILDFAHANEHYKKAATLDATFRQEDVRSSIARVTEKAAHQDQIDYLAEIEALIGRRRYDEALARADAFKDKFPESPLLANAKKAHDHVLKAREKYVSERIATLWFLRSSQLARLMSTKLGYEEAINYLGGQMQKEVLDYVSKEALLLTKDATPDAVKKLWTQRKRTRWQRASYGFGTWLLGRDAALKGSDEKKTDAKPLTEKDKERADLEKKLQRYLENQELARKAKSSNDQKDDREAAWKELSPDNRAGWILAYYCENSGDFEVDPKPILTACKECGGSGTRVLSLAGGNVSRSAVGKQATDTKLECNACHGLGAIRRISYR